MNCAEFHEVLSDVLEGGTSIEPHTHMRACAQCSQLVSEINFISQQAKLLQSVDEPSPRVWNSIEIALRQEGLIRKPVPEFEIIRKSSPHWTMAWLLPATAAFLVTFGVLRYEHRIPTPQVAVQSAPTPAPAAPVAASAALASRHMSTVDDEQLLKVVGSRSPAMRDSYAKELKHVNEYIRDAEQSADDNPNDEFAQQYLMNAYEQKAVVYELAMDRTLQ